MPIAIWAFFTLVIGMTAGDQLVQAVSYIDIQKHHLPGYGMRVWTAPRQGAAAIRGVCKVRFYVVVVGGGRARLNSDGEMLKVNTAWHFDREVPENSRITKHFWMYDEVTGAPLYAERDFVCGGNRK